MVNENGDIANDVQLLMDFVNELAGPILGPEHVVIRPGLLDEEGEGEGDGDVEGEGDGEGDEPAEEGGVQEFGKVMAQKIRNDIAKLGNDFLPVFNTVLQDQADIVCQEAEDEKLEMMADQENAQDELENLCEQVETTMANDAENMMVTLEDMQTTMEQLDGDARDLAQIELITLKNECWKELSWIVRESFAQSQARFGYSAGNVEGLAQMRVNRFAQTKQAGADGYDTYGYGDLGYGYGPQQDSYNEIREKIKVFEDAVQALRDGEAAKLEESKENLNDAMDAAMENLENMQDEQLEMLDTMIADMAEEVQDEVDEIVEEMGNVIDDARAAIDEARNTKDNAQTEAENVIRLSIEAIKNADVRDALTTLLDNQIAELNQRAERAEELCTEKFDQALEDIADAAEDLNQDNTGEVDNMEDVANGEMENLNDFVDEANDRMDDFAEGETDSLEDFLADCEAAW
jgi:hypothetical protein